MAKTDTTECSFDVQNSFGPVVAGGCYGGFDFTLLFEESILTLLPLGIAVLWGIFCVVKLQKERPKIRPSWALALKMILFATYLVLLISILVVWISTNVPRTRLTITSLSLTVAGYLFLLVLSYLEHNRSWRPSTPLCVHLGISTIFDAARVRTLFALLPGHAVPRLLLASVCLKTVLLASEVAEKRRLLFKRWQSLSLETTSGVFNRSLFVWLNKLLVMGFRNILTVNLLEPIDDEMLAASTPEVLRERWRAADKTKDHALLFTFLWYYKAAFLAGVLPRVAETGFLFSQPFLMPKVLDYVKDKSDSNKATAYGLIAAYAIVYIGVAVSYALYQHKVYRLLTLFRGSLIALIYEKTLDIDSSLLSEAEAVTLMSADIDRIGVSLPVIHEVWASLLETALCLWLLYRLLKVALTGAILWTIICLIIGLPVATLAGNAQAPWLEAIRDRLTATAKSLGSIKAVKLTGLSDIVAHSIAELRRIEIAVARRYRVLNIMLFVIYFASSSLTPVWGFGVFVLLAKSKGSDTLTESTVFPALSLFKLLDQPLVHALYGFQHVRTVMTSFNRIQKYLISRERESLSPVTEFRARDPLSSDTRVYNDHGSDDMTLHELSDLDWTEPEHVASMKDAGAGYTTGDGLVLRKLDLIFARGRTTVVLGPVGSGKSTLLRLLLREVPIVIGSVTLKYTNAAYCPQVPWLIRGSIRTNIVGPLDWDGDWYDTIIEACALSHEIDQLETQHEGPRGPGGSKLSGGQQMRVSLARALYSRSPVMIFDDVFAGLDRATERHVLDAVFGPVGLLKKLKSTVVFATASATHLSVADSVITINDKGTVEQREPGAPLEFDVEKSEMTENISPMKQETSGSASQDDQDENNFSPELDMLDDPQTDSGRQTGDWTIYTYFAGIAGRKLVAIWLTACAIYIFALCFPSVWLEWWVKANEDHPNERIGYWLGVYGGLAALAVVGSGVSESVYNLGMIPRISKRFHELLLDTTMRAPSSFFTATDTGSILTRFSQDLQLIDNDLPLALGRAVFQFLYTIASSVLVFMGSGYLAIAIPFCIVMLFGIQFYYLRTSRQLRLLDIEAKAPLFAVFLETISGVASIRAYGWASSFRERNRNALDVSQKPYYLLWCIQRWLTLVLDLFNAGLAIMLVSIAVTTKNGSTEFLGVALFSIVTFGATLQALINQWTLVETALGAISRIRSYVADVKNENLPGESGEVSLEWPRQGKIELKNVSASYEGSPNPVLKNVSLSIKPGEKMAICGRTGSGKSSLVATLLRTIELDSGNILIDNVDITTLPRHEVRSRINTLPQSPLLLHGTVRHNIDPYGRAGDALLVEVLRSVSLWDLVASRGGLDAPVRQDELSAGQRQLLCLARAVVRQGSVLVMDEATSGADAATDALVQRVVREDFRETTIVAVVHKLHTVLDFDQVVVLDEGEIVERGRPSELMEVAGSRFRVLYDSLNAENGC